MAGLPFHYVDLRAFGYATEDEERVWRALHTFLPEDAEIEREVTEGHAGDRILVFSARVENADDVRHVFERVREAPSFDRIVAELDQRIDENCSLFLRLDKQAAFQGRVELGEGITLRAKVEAYPAKKELAVENARDALGT